ncbi:gamma-glutamyl-gamma-aminobutyrate hydrolase family protein [Eubacteriales bacterium OttesenSCG-928-N13]|nr:gamma-glutamyl-gamma-aminobutyrate hydrolase family protein [Eubacteriales bacterium OttesenSCG-928-N13]
MNKPRIGFIPSSEERDITKPTPSPHCLEAIRRAGGDVVMIDYQSPSEEQIKRMDRIDGLFLQGGGDMDPSRFGEPRHPKCGPTFPERDALELMLIKQAMDRDMPLMAICRGAQVLNVALGGTLYQDLPDELGLHHDLGVTASGEHIVQIEPGSLVHQITQTQSLPTNSTHHQSVKRLGDGLAITARHPDGVIEAIERPASRFLLALQWHPEHTIDIDDASIRFFEAFIGACQTH